MFEFCIAPCAGRRWAPSPAQSSSKMRFLAASPVLDRSCFLGGDWHTVWFSVEQVVGVSNGIGGSERSCLLRTIGTCQVQEVVGFLFSLVRGACCFVFWRAGVWSPLFRLYSHLVSTFLSSHTWSTYLPLRVCLGNQKPCPCSSYSAGWLCYITITI